MSHTLQNRTHDNTYPKFGNPVSYPVLEDVCQVVPVTGRTRDRSYRETRTPISILSILNFFTFKLRESQQCITTMYYNNIYVCETKVQ